MSDQRTTATEQIQKLGERIAAKLNIPANEIRYGYYIVHNNHQWTVEYRWERFVGGRWIEIEDEDWAELHGTPKD